MPDEPLPPSIPAVADSDESGSESVFLGTCEAAFHVANSETDLVTLLGAVKALVVGGDGGEPSRWRLCDPPDSLTPAAVSSAARAKRDSEPLLWTPAVAAALGDLLWSWSRRDTTSSAPP